MIDVVTSMNSNIYCQYGKEMIDSFIKNWPITHKLYVYSENISMPEDNERVSFVHLRNPNLYDFIDRNSCRQDQKNPLELAKGAVRFSYKSFSIIEHAKKSKNFVWLDADTKTYRQIPEGFIEELSNDRFVSFLGRKNNYTECGFVIYMNGDYANPDFFSAWENLYVTDEIFDLPQWHDSYLFDHLRNKYLDETQMNNLTPWGKDFDHVFINSEIGKYIDHKKGNRKISASRISDLLPQSSTEIREYIESVNNKT